MHEVSSPTPGAGFDHDRILSADHAISMLTAGFERQSAGVAAVLVASAGKRGEAVVAQEEVDRATALVRKLGRLQICL